MPLSEQRSEVVPTPMKVLLGRPTLHAFFPTKFITDKCPEGQRHCGWGQHHVTPHLGLFPHCFTFALPSHPAAPGTCLQEVGGGGAAPRGASPSQDISHLSLRFFVFFF